MIALYSAFIIIIISSSLFAQDNFTLNGVKETDQVYHSFINVDMEDSEFNSTKFGRAVFINVNGEETNFNSSSMPQAQISQSIF